MRNLNCNVLTALDNQTTNGIQIDANQLISASFHCYFGDTQAAGTFKLQVSNDIAPARNMAPIDGFAVTNWTDLPNQSATISSGASALLTVANMTYRWIRAVYADTATGVQTIVPVADTGAFETITVTVPDTASAAQGDYFIIYGTQNHYAALWLDIDGAGVAPTGAIYLASSQKFKISISTGNSAITNGGILATAINASILGYAAVDNGDGTVTLTGEKLGPTNAPATHNANDSGAGSFLVHVDLLGVVSNLQSTYFLLQDQASVHSYYVWFNVSSLGVDPVIAGRTGVEMDITAGDAAATIGAALATAIAALNSSNSFTTSGTTTVTVTNKTSGPFVPMTDGATKPTSFTFTVTGGGHANVVINMNALSL